MRSVAPTADRRVGRPLDPRHSLFWTTHPNAMNAPHITSRLPAPVGRFFALFPLVKYPEIVPSTNATRDADGTPTLWIRPPPQDDDREDVLSADVECLKWQAYLALRSTSETQQHRNQRFHIHWDVHSAGAIGGHLPNLYLADGQLLPSHDIPDWMDKHLGGGSEDGLDGYLDAATRDESRAWVSLLEGNVHAALVSTLLPSHWLCF
jgi:metaxin